MNLISNAKMNFLKLWEDSDDNNIERQAPQFNVSRENAMHDIPAWKTRGDRSPATFADT